MTKRTSMNCARGSCKPSRWAQHAYLVSMSYDDSSTESFSKRTSAVKALSPWLGGPKQPEPLPLFVWILLRWQLTTCYKIYVYSERLSSSKCGWSSMADRASMQPPKAPMRESYLNQTLPVVLHHSLLTSESVDGGSKPGCYSYIDDLGKQFGHYRHPTLMTNTWKYGWKLVSFHFLSVLLLFPFFHFRIFK